jgi:hypothetical protein
MLFSVLAILLALPSVGYLVIHFAFNRRRSASTDTNLEADETIDSSLKNTKPPRPYASHNPNSKIRKAAEELAREGKYAEKAIQFAVEAFEKQPELWSDLCREIALIPLDGKPAPLDVLNWWQGDIARIGTDGDKDEQTELTTICSALIACTWYLNVASQPLDIAETRYVMSVAYTRLAHLLPKREEACREVALNCCLHALELYRQSNEFGRQIKALCQIGNIYIHRPPSEIDQVVRWQTAIDYYKQAQALLSFAADIPLQAVYTIYYSGLGNINFDLYYALHKQEYLQGAFEAYTTLDGIYKNREPGNTNALNNINKKLYDIRNILQQSQRPQQYV